MELARSATGCLQVIRPAHLDSLFMTIPTRMHAVRILNHGQDLDLYEVVDHAPVPKPAPDEVLVRVLYGALNRLDDFVRVGWPGIGLPLPHIPGSDFVGRIVALGEEATGWQEGQVVTGNNALWCGSCQACALGRTNLCESFGILGESRAGVMCEFLALPARNLVAVPEGFDLAKAAAASLTYLTAWHSLVVKGSLEPGETVLVIGAGGGVNVAAQQIADLRGCDVYVVASTKDKADRARADGAHWVFDRSAKEDWASAVKDATQGRGVDMVVDNVGGDTLKDSLRTLALGGRLVTVGGTSGYDATFPLSSFFMRHLSILGSTMGTQADYHEVMQLIFEGRLQPVVDSVVAPCDYGKAIRRMQMNQHYGKIVVNLQDWE